MVKAERMGAQNGVKVGRGFRAENGHDPSFAGSFIAAARGCGIETLTEFSRGSGIRVDVLSLWVNGREHPSPEKMQVAVSYLTQIGAPDALIEELNGHYEAYRQERLSRYQERNIGVARKKRMDPPLPLGRFIDRLADNRDTTVAGLNRSLRFKTDWLSHIRVQKDMTEETLLKLLAALGESGALTEEEMVQMEEAARDTILKIVEEKGRMVPVSPLSVKRQQGDNPSCVIYTGEQAGEMLGISRSAVARWRRRLGMAMLLASGDVAAIRGEKNGKNIQPKSTLNYE